jgi:hypothetical protein
VYRYVMVANYGNLSRSATAIAAALRSADHQTDAEQTAIIIIILIVRMKRESVIRHSAHQFF